jgi:hypothetical protein
VHDLVPPDLVHHEAVEPVELLHHGAHREDHVVPGVAVGDREHVEVVDLDAAGLEVRARHLDHSTEALYGRIGHLLDSTLPAGMLVAQGLAYQAALVTLFAFRQRAQTYTRRGVPASSIRTFWRLGLKRRRVATMEWLRELPNAGPLPQLKQTLAMRA